MNILVTGATGFVGGYILNYLKEKFPNASLSGTGRNKEKAEILRKRGFDIITGDITDIDFVNNSLSDFTHIIHSAARSSIWGKYKEFYCDNVVATKNLLDGVDKLERFIFISTANIYFDLNDRTDVREDDPIPEKRVSYYPLTKYLAEQEVLNTDRDIHTVSLRPRGIIGPGDTTSMPRIIRAYKEDKIKIVGDGKNIVDFTSVENLAHAVVLSLKAGPETSGQAYNITDGTNHKFWQLMQENMLKLGFNKTIPKLNYRVVYLFAWLTELFARIRQNGEPSLTRYAAAVMKVSFTLNIDKAKKELAYTPVISTEKCIDDYIIWAKENADF